VIGGTFVLHVASRLAAHEGRERLSMPRSALDPS
jgi:hypothetical protein